MPDKSFLDWPFFEDRHRAFQAELESWCAKNLTAPHMSSSGAQSATRGPRDHDSLGPRVKPEGDSDEVDARCRELVARLGRDGFLAHTATDPHSGGALDVRTLCLARETLARHDGLSDFAFAMQGLGAGAITLFGTHEQRSWLSATRAGKAIAAFALTEEKSGSDVANIALVATRDGEGWRLDGEKTWISNGGIADLYVVFARTGEAPGTKGISAFVVPADTPGLEIAERQQTIAPHPLARLKFSRARLPASALIGRAGDGFRIAMSVLDVFRTTVGAAALGFARRAFDETLKRVSRRELFGAPMAELQMVQGHVADMALDIDAAALLVYRAAWTKDTGAARVSREASMAKLFATERAQRVIDTAVQLHGGDGVRLGSPVERLYREIRALRIYEGASDVQKIVIARQALGDVK